MTVPILTFPSIRGPSTVEWYLQGQTQSQESPFDGTVQTIGMPGARWRGTVSYAALRAPDHRALSAFLARLQGRSGRFTYSPPQAWRQAAHIAVPGPVQINGANQVGDVLNMKGFPASVTVFWPGDYISWDGVNGRAQLHQVVNFTGSDADGLLTAQITPPIRSPGADNATVEIEAAIGVFMLADDSQGHAVHTGETPLRAAISFEIIEAPVA